MKKIDENRKITLTLGQLKRLVKESEDEGNGVFALEIYDISYETDPDFDPEWHDNVPKLIYSKEFHDWEEAWDEAEKKVEQYKDKKGKFIVRVTNEVYQTSDGGWDFVDSEDDLLSMLSGTDGYQGLLNMA